MISFDTDLKFRETGAKSIGTRNYRVRSKENRIEIKRHCSECCDIDMNT